MKLALISFTLFCVYVSVSHQQQFIQRRYPLPPFYNNYYPGLLPLSRNVMKQAPLFIIRNNYVQPYSLSNPSFDDQVQMVTQSI